MRQSWFHRLSILFLKYKWIHFIKLFNLLPSQELQHIFTVWRQMFHWWSWCGTPGLGGGGRVSVEIQGPALRRWGDGAEEHWKGPCRPIYQTMAQCLVLCRRSQKKVARFNEELWPWWRALNESSERQGAGALPPLTPHTTPPWQCHQPED